MRVLHVGNIANVPYLLCYGLRELGIKTCLVAKDQDYNFLYSEDNNPYGVKFLLLRRFDDYVRFLRLVREAEILHFHSNTSFKQFLLKVRHRVKLVRQFQGSDIRELPWLKKKILKASSLFFGETVLVSGFDLVKYWEDALYLPNPIDPIFFEDAQVEEVFSIFLPTRLDNRTKNVDFAFKAWEILKQMNRDVFLKVILWGEDKDYYFARYRQDRRIIWSHTMSPEKMSLEMKKSSLIWGQFRLGSFGLTELQGMAAGKTVLMRYNIDKAALGYTPAAPPVISVATPEELAQETSRLLYDKKARTNFGREARKWAERNHSVRNVALRLKSIYEEIV